jgi:hypothetical protein
MKRLWPCLATLLIGCVTTSAPPPPERVAGCWISGSVDAMTLNWTPDQQTPGSLTGVRRHVRDTTGQETQSYRLTPAEGGWQLCDEAAGGRCWRVAEGDEGSLEGGRAFIDQHGDRLRIAVLGDGPEQVIFVGRRQTCG